MIRVTYSAAFLRQAKKLEPKLLDDLIAAVEAFKDRKNHTRLRVHKLHAELSRHSSFSVNYRYRVVFEWRGKNEAVLHAVGDHSIYD